MNDLQPGTCWRHCFSANVRQPNPRRFKRGQSQTIESTRSSHFQLQSQARISVQNSVDGARRRLTRPTCQNLFTGFVDRHGDTLATILAASGQTAEKHLDNLYFVEANTLPQCSGNQTRMAFTTPGRRVIYLCGARFVPYFARNNTGAEILIIHELLHSLGLGENPPTSADITDRVIARCGDNARGETRKDGRQ